MNLNFDKYLELFCLKEFNNQAIKIPVVEMEHSRIQECYFNVEECVKLYGGSQIFGWKIYKNNLPLFIEAEMHSIWLNNKNELIDITPNTEKSNPILFVIDKSIVFDGTGKSNIRKAFIRNIEIADYLLFLEFEDKITLKEIGKATKNSNRRVYLPKETNEAKDFIANMLRRSKFNVETECCPNKKYKNCHHNIYKELLSKYCKTENIKLSTYDKIFSLIL